MLTYRLTGTPEHSGSTTTNPASLSRTNATGNNKPRRIFGHHGAPRRRRRLADLRFCRVSAERLPEVIGSLTAVPNGAGTPAGA
jgi:hypothetical protein